MDDRFAGKSAQTVFWQFFGQSGIPAGTPVVFPYRTGNHVIHTEYGDDIGKNIRNGTYGMDGLVIMAPETEHMAEVVATHADVEDIGLHGIQFFL